GNYASGSSGNGLTVIDLAANTRQTFVLGGTPFSVAFGIDNRALVATSAEFLSFDPATGNSQVVGSIAGVTTKSLPQPVASFPNSIVGASMTASGDGLFIFGSALASGGSSGGSGGGASGGGNQTLEYTYDVTTRSLKATLWIWGTVPGPRAVSTNFDGTLHMSAWSLYDRTHDMSLSFYHVQNLDAGGTHVFDSARGRIYAQFVEKAAAAAPGVTTTVTLPTPAPLLILDADNLRQRDKLLVPENFSGKSVLSSDGAVMYGISDSGVMIVPIGDLSRIPRLTVSKEDLTFKGNFCDRRISTQEVTIIDPSGAATDFALSSTTAGISFTPARGVTPATVRITVDPSAFQNQKGTVTAQITIQSVKAANVASPIRVLINNKEPDQRGTSVNIPGQLYDLLADPVRDRFYIIRNDRDEVLVFDGANQTQIATLRTGHRPSQLAVTFDRRYLLVAHRNAQVIKVFDLETLEEALPIRIPGCAPFSVAVSGKSILAIGWCLGTNQILKVDLLSRTASFLPSLGVYENKNIDLNAIMTGSPNGSTILVAQPDGSLYLYNANVDTFTASRKDLTALDGAYAASSYDQYVVGNFLLNASLVPTGVFSASTGRSSGFAFLDQGGFRVTAADSAGPGVIQRVTAQGPAQSTRLVEAPLLPPAPAASTGGTTTTTTPAPAAASTSPTFTRTIQPLYGRNALIALTTSGFTVIPWNFDAAVASPRLERVVNLADGAAPVAPGSLVAISGNNLSPINLASQQMPLPTALGESCLTVNGVPLPVVFVSPTQINGQIPFSVDGNVALILRTPGGVSDTFNLTILPGAPGIFRNGSAGGQTDLPAVFRASNGLLVTDTNPVHRGDTISIYVTGLGRTSPAVDAGVPAPGDPLATALVQPTVTIAGMPAPVEFAGLVPGSVGVYVINARVLSNTPPGLQQTLFVSQGGTSTAISVRVVD
ncbi:MAG: hypothetical protein HYZ37_03375, partial [Candidatus Solibacter usitatus]|nr:hypothetical protein [Candidatus Solibacter usitatus]